MHEADGQVRRAVLFVTDDTITQPLPNEVGNADFQYFLRDVAMLADTGKAPVRRGCVVEPCHVQCVKDREWKLARYWDPDGRAADQWELYSQVHAPNEEVNLAGGKEDGRPYVRADALPAGWGLSAAAVEAALARMLELLDEYCARMLGAPEESGNGAPGGGPRRVWVGANFVSATRLEEGAIAP